jgi:hypothetical protein
MKQPCYRLSRLNTFSGKDEDDLNGSLQARRKDVRARFFARPGKNNWYLNDNQAVRIVKVVGAQALPDPARRGPNLLVEF